MFPGTMRPFVLRVEEKNKASGALITGGHTSAEDDHLVSRGVFSFDLFQVYFVF